MGTARLALADGTILTGQALGARGHSVGECVFNTAMTGYQEIISDPSYAKQIVTLTYPHIGNVGCNADDQERDSAHLSGLVIRQNSLIVSNWRSEQSLDDYLKQHNIVAIADVDTRFLTQHLRDNGAQNGCIVTDDLSDKEAIAKANDMPSLHGMDLAKVVTCDETHPYTTEGQQHIVVVDFGLKMTMLKIFAKLNCRLTCVPATTTAEEILSHQPDGVFLSNGPGDPAACDYAIQMIRELLDKNIPLFGICLGYQLLALAAGAKTFKMKFGHHGANHPVVDKDTGRVLITSQNHGFAVDEDSLPDNLRVTHRSLFDNTLQGLRLTNKPAFGFQGHPEASPGPHELRELFEHFIELIEKQHA
jgi:carbamoyl-phosphate synthase small subunit